MLLRVSHEIFTEALIEAPAERVWSVLTDFAAYPSWNPLVRKAEGTLEVGRKLAVSIHLPSGFRMRIAPRIIALEPGKSFAWRGGVIRPGVFDGEHRFEVIALGPKQTRLIQAERFDGFLVPIVGGLVIKLSQPGFVAMNDALKERSES
jgi:hypothetical protein